MESTKNTLKLFFAKMFFILYNSNENKIGRGFYKMIYWDNYPKVELKLKQLYEEYHSDYNKIAEKMEEEFVGENKLFSNDDGKKFTYNSVRNRIRRSDIIEYQPNKKEDGIFEGFVNEKEPRLFSHPEIEQKLYGVIGKFDREYAEGATKALVLSDIHIPYQNIDGIEKAVSDNLDADILVIPGDFLSYEAYSYWGNTKNITVKEEHKKAFDFLERLTDLFDWIVIHDGNHEERSRRYLENKNEIVGLTPHINYKEPLRDVVKYFDNISYVPHYFIQLGDFVFGHPKRYSSIPMRTSVFFLDSLIGRAHIRKFGEVNGVGIGHTHRGGKISHKGFGVMEFGYLANEMDYYKHRQTKEKWERGYGIVQYYDGKFDYNESDFIKLND